MLRDLLGKQVVVKRVSPTISVTTHIARYVDDAGGPSALCACDITLASSMGAALALIPSRVAVEAARRGELSPEMLDNLHEVLNVASALFLGAHVHLAEVVVVRRPDVSAGWRSRLDLEVGVAGYDGGHLALMVDPA
jgi:hypothetical protein